MISAQRCLSAARQGIVPRGLSALIFALALMHGPPVRAQDRQQVAPAQGSSAGSSASEAQPSQDALTADVLLGRWCGETTNYTFSGTELRVDFHNGGSRVLRIDHIKTGDTWVDVHWVGKRDDGSSNNTVFSEFSADRNVMFQAANVGGDKGPRRRFWRC